jgi:hypothetical protein
MIIRRCACPLTVVAAAVLLLSGCSDGGSGGGLIENLRAEKQKSQQKHEGLFRDISRMLREANVVRTADENDYNALVGAIIPRLSSCKSRDDVRRVVHGAFVQRFTAKVAGPESRYDGLAGRIWSRMSTT